MKIKTLKCAECGCEFTASIKSTKAKSKSISSQSKIEEIIKLAEKNNMSYGEYQAMLRSK